MTLTSAQPEDWLFPVYPVRYPAAFSLVNMMLLLSHWSVSRRGSSCSASLAPSTSSPSWPGTSPWWMIQDTARTRCWDPTIVLWRIIHVKTSDTTQEAWSTSAYVIFAKILIFKLKFIILHAYCEFRQFWGTLSGKYLNADMLLMLIVVGVCECSGDVGVHPWRDFYYDNTSWPGVWRRIVCSDLATALIGHCRRHAHLHTA